MNLRAMLKVAVKIRYNKELLGAFCNETFEHASEGYQMTVNANS